MTHAAALKSTYLSPHPLVYLAVVLVVSRVLLAVIVWPDTQRLYNGDSWLYEQHALSMLETGSWLAPGYGNIDANPFADMIRPPGYPLLLTAVYALAGNEAAPWVMFALNTMALFALVWLMYAFLRVTGLQRAWPVLFILVADPAWWMYSKELITEPWFNLLLMTAVILVYIAVAPVAKVLTQKAAGEQPDELPNTDWPDEQPYSDRPDEPPCFEQPDELPYSRRRWLLAGGGLALGLATWFKPVTLYAPWFAFIAIVVTMMVQREEIFGRMSLPTARKRSLTAAALFLIAALLLPASWQVRNYATHGSFVYTSIAAENMMTGHAAFVLASREGITHLEAQERIRERYRSANPNEATMTFAMQHEAKMAVAREILRENRAVYAKTILRGMAVAMMDPGRRVFARTFRSEDVAVIGLTNTLSKQGIAGTVRTILREDPVLVLYASGYMLLLGLFFVATVWGSVRLYRYNPLLAIVLGTSVIYLWVLSGPNGYARFRLYIMPFMILLCAGWFTRGKSRT